MSRTAVIVSTLLAGLGLPASAAAAEPRALPKLSASVAACDTGPALEQRAADFEGSMPAIANSSVLAMRFTVEERRGSTWRAVSVPGSRWERSTTGAAGFVFDKRVERLEAGAAYRVVVRFRWYDDAGSVIKRATRKSRSCRQPDLRPDLSVVALIPGEPLGDGRARYVVQVRNGGLSAVRGALRVGLSVDGVAQPSRSLAGLAANVLGAVAFEGSACRPGGTVRAVVDPQDDVEEVDEADNVLELRCPNA